MFPNMMIWETPLYPLDDVDAAGKTLIKHRVTQTEIIHAFDVIDNWRAVHAFPLNTFQVYLRKKAKGVDETSLVAQRIKRLASIEQKLERMPWLRLSEVQDIGGCRAVVSSVTQVEELVKIYKDSDLKHKLIDEDNYILTPRRSGYRSHHLIYSYYSDKKTTYNGRKIEIQLRSRLRHAWATAVETVSTFTRQALKANRGQRDWKRFFALMGTVMSLEEGTSPVSDTPSDTAELLRELRDCADCLQIETRLFTYGSALKTLESPKEKMHFYLLVLDPTARTVDIKGFKLSQIEIALKEYTEKEKELRDNKRGEAVLVSVDSVAALKSAYPNYFLDTVLFRNELKKALSGKISEHN